MKVALVGLGYWGSKLLRNLVSVVEPWRVIAIDSRPHRLADAQQAYPGIELASSAAVACADGDVGAVIIATPVSTHAQLARQALAAGHHVLVEKPLAGSVADAVDLVRMAEERDLILMAGHTFLFSPRVAAVADAIEKGAVGALHYATSSRLNLGLHRSDANVIWDLAPHDFSIVLHLFREMPISVQTTAQSLTGVAMPDVAFISLTFPSGAIASITVSWLAPRKVRSTVLVGERGMIVYDDTQADEPVKIYDRGVVREESASFADSQFTYRYGDTVAPHVPSQEPLTLELRHFLSCAQSGEEPVSDGSFGLQVVKVLDAADRSWQNGGRPVTIDR